MTSLLGMPCLSAVKGSEIMLRDNDWKYALLKYTTCYYDVKLITKSSYIYKSSFICVDLYKSFEIM